MKKGKNLKKNSIFTISIFTNKFVILTIISSIVLQFIVIETPFLANLLKITVLPKSSILKILAISFIVIAVAEFYKVIYRRKGIKS